MDEQLFQEYDTVSGQAQVRFNRFKGFLRSNWKIIAPFIAIACVAGYFIASHVQLTAADHSDIHKSGGHGHDSTTPTSSPNPDINYNHRNSGHALRHGSHSDDPEDENRLVFIGNETFREFTDFSDVDNAENVSSITLRHIELHGPSFTKSIEEFRNLEILRLENVTIHELLLTKRVRLPKLKYFSVYLASSVYKISNKVEQSDKKEHQHEKVEEKSVKDKDKLAKGGEKSDKEEHKSEESDKKEHESEKSGKHEKREEKSVKGEDKHGKGGEKSDKKERKSEKSDKHEKREQKWTKSKHEHEVEQPEVREILKSILFFKKEKADWDFDKDLVNLGVEIRVRMDGSKLLTIAQRSGELMLNFKSCEKILKNLKWMPHVLTLAGCKAHGKDILRVSTEELRYLNLNNISLTDTELAEVIKKRHLTELLLNIPNGTLDLADVPKSVKFLSLSGMNVKVNSKKYHGFGASSVREFIISDGALEENLVSNFKGVLPEAETLALFNMKHTGSRRKILGNILKTEASRIIVGNLTTISSKEDEHFENGTLTVDGEEVDEGYLEGIGVPKHAKHFLITLPPKGDADSQVGIPLSVHETRFFHFTLSEKNKVMTFHEYLKVVAEKPKQNE